MSFTDNVKKRGDTSSYQSFYDEPTETETFGTRTVRRSGRKSPQKTSNVIFFDPKGVVTLNFLMLGLAAVLIVIEIIFMSLTSVVESNAASVPLWMGVAAHRDEWAPYVENIRVVAGTRYHAMWMILAATVWRFLFHTTCALNSLASTRKDKKDPGFLTRLAKYFLFTRYYQTVSVGQHPQRWLDYCISLSLCNLTVSVLVGDAYYDTIVPFFLLSASVFMFAHFTEYFFFQANVLRGSKMTPAFNLWLGYARIANLSMWGLHLTLWLPLLANIGGRNVPAAQVLMVLVNFLFTTFLLFPCTLRIMFDKSDLEDYKSAMTNGGWWVFLEWYYGFFALLVIVSTLSFVLGIALGQKDGNTMDFVSGYLSMY